jgi:hypothetical protein
MLGCHLVSWSLGLCRCGHCITFVMLHHMTLHHITLHHMTLHHMTFVKLHHSNLQKLAATLNFDL